MYRAPLRFTSHQDLSGIVRDNELLTQFEAIPKERRRLMMRVRRVRVLPLRERDAIASCYLAECKHSCAAASLGNSMT